MGRTLLVRSDDNILLTAAADGYCHNENYLNTIINARVPNIFVAVIIIIRFITGLVFIFSVAFFPSTRRRRRRNGVDARRVVFAIFLLVLLQSLIPPRPYNNIIIIVIAILSP